MGLISFLSSIDNKRSLKRHNLKGRKHMLYFMIISGAFLVGVGINTALMNCIRNLVRDTEEMEDTDNSFLKQMKLRYKNCMRIGHEIRNTEAFAGKYMDKYTSYGLSFAAYEKIISVCGGICVVAAMAGAMLDRSRLLQYLLLGFLHIKEENYEKKKI